MTDDRVLLRAIEFAAEVPARIDRIWIDYPTAVEVIPLPAADGTIQYLVIDEIDAGL